MIEMKDGALRLYGEIGGYFEDGVGAKDFGKVLDGLGGNDLTMYINSDGGDVFDGLAIYNQLRRYKGDVKIVVDSLAASIASVIAMAADELVMMPQSFLMIHNPWTAAMGDAAEFRGVADLLDLIGGQIADIYATRSGQTQSRFLDLMSGETWLTASDAMEMGLADRIEGDDDMDVANAMDTRRPVASAGGFTKRIAASHSLRRSLLR